jgi:uncharacterized protein YjdB
MTLTAGGDTGTLVATVAPANATNKNVTWASDNEAVATVVNGVVTPVAAGTATITVTTEDGGKTATCAVTVNPASVAVTGVTLDQSTMTLTAGGDTGTLVATVAPANATNKNVTWSTSNAAVATVANGVVTPVAEGTATITVTTEDGGKTATCAVTVQAVAAKPFTITGSLDRTSGIKATTTVNRTNAPDHNGNEVVIFQLMKNGNEPVSIVALEKNIQADETLIAHFNVTGMEYTVKVFVFDQFTSDTGSASTNLAVPQVLQ